jgi:hypothetical protein
MLKLNPDDDQGVRYLIGIECLHAGDDEGAIDAFRSRASDEVGCAFGLALAKLRVHGPSAEIGQALLTGFAANRYVAPILLGESLARLDGFHGTNMAEPEWAQDVVDAQAELWHAIPEGANQLRFWWMAPPVASWRRKLDAIMVSLKDLPASNERSAVVSEGRSLRSADTVRDLVRAVRRLS